MVECKRDLHDNQRFGTLDIGDGRIRMSKSWGLNHPASDEPGKRLPASHRPIVRGVAKDDPDACVRG